MIQNLKPYPAYRDSGVEWLGEVPTDWEIRRVKWLFQKMERPVQEKDEVVTCFRDGMVTLRKNRRERGFTESLKEIGYQGVRQGDLVVHGMDAFSGAVGVSDSDGKCTPVYSICRPTLCVNARFYAFIVNEMARTGWITALAKGIRERSTDFRYTEFASQEVPLPSIYQQSAIVRFLDHADRRLRRAVRAKRQLIALLNEQKQAIIHRAVTRGLDPDVPLNFLCNRWFPEIPEHWDLLPMRRVIKRTIDGPHHSPTYLDNGIPFLSARNVKKDRWSLEDVKYISESDYHEFSKRVVPGIGDVLYTKGGTTGVARAVDFAFRFQVWVHIAVLKLNKEKIIPDYLAMALNSPRCYEQAQLFTRGATNQDLGLGRMKDIVLPVPSVLEQVTIIDTVKEASATLDHAIDATQREIDLLLEFRTRLIADVVTGKLDVREAAAGLPDEAEEPALFDEFEVPDDEEQDASVDLDVDPEGILS